MDLLGGELGTGINMFVAGLVAVHVIVLVSLRAVYMNSCA
jgi:hypothetical protein